MGLFSKHKFFVGLKLFGIEGDMIWCVIEINIKTVGYRTTQAVVGNTLLLCFIFFLYFQFKLVLYHLFSRIL